MIEDSNLEQSKMRIDPFFEIVNWLESSIVTGRVEPEGGWDCYVHVRAEQLLDAVKVYCDLNESFLEYWEAEPVCDSDGNDVPHVDITHRLTKEEKKKVEEASLELARCLNNMGASVNECFSNAKEHGDDERQRLAEQGGYSPEM